jgi:cytochrome c5
MNSRASRGTRIRQIVVAMSAVWTCVQGRALGAGPVSGQAISRDVPRVAIGERVAAAEPVQRNPAQRNPAQRNPVEPAAASPDRVASDPLDSRCERCHRFPHGLSHPIDVVPGVTPKELPLEAGRMTCLTCHDERAQRSHGSVSSMGATGGTRSTHAERDPMLRLDSVEALCGTCHAAGAAGKHGGPMPHRTVGFGPQRNAVRRADQAELDSVHAMGILKAHLTSSGNSPMASHSHRGTLLEATAGVDAESASCLACHDGTVASDVGGHAEGDWAGKAASGSRTRGIRAAAMDGPSSHPIGVPYRSTSGPEAIELRPAASLDPRIRLFNHNVGCGSCHSVYSRQPDYVVFPNDRSVLCLSCHRM